MDINDITQYAKEMLLQHGSHIPTFFVERKGDQVDMIILDHLEDSTMEKIRQFFTIGRGLARKHHWKAKEIREIIFVVEAWMSTQVAGEQRTYARPADDPERKECLIVSKLAVKPRLYGKPKLVTTMQIVEMLRAGDSLDLLPMPGEIKECDHRLLTAFLAGITSTEFTEEQLVAMVKPR
jgi:hypothetical protein